MSANPFRNHGNDQLDEAISRLATQVEDLRTTSGSTRTEGTVLWYQDALNAAVQERERRKG